MDSDCNAADWIVSEDVQSRRILDLGTLTLDAKPHHPPIPKKRPAERDIYVSSTKPTTPSNNLDQDVNPKRPMRHGSPSVYDPNSPKPSTTRTTEPYTRWASCLQLQRPYFYLSAEVKQTFKAHDESKYKHVFHSWQVASSSHMTLSNEHYDFFLANQRPPASPFLRKAGKMARMNPSVPMLHHDKFASGIAMDELVTIDTDATEPCSNHVIPGTLDSQHTVEATGDTGAKYNFLNEAYAKQCNFKIDPTTRKSIIIASGKKVMTSGVAEVFFRFQSEQTPYPLKFHILPGCVKNVILGKSFLKTTKTFSDALNFAKRVVKRFTRSLSTQQVLFLGASFPVFAGLLNGKAEAALADSASKVLIIDEDYARMRGLSILSTKETRVKLRFADGSTAFTSGKTHNVVWQFGHGRRYPLDFYILKNAPANVILSEDFLLRETRAFIEHAHFLIEDEEDEDVSHHDDNDDEGHFFAIDLDKNYRPTAYTQGVEQYFEDDRETFRRAEEDLHVARLVGVKKDAAIAKVEVRRTQWAAKQVANRLNQGIQHTTVNAAGPPAAPQLQISNAAGVPSTSKRRRWRFGFMRKQKSGQSP